MIITLDNVNNILPLPILDHFCEFESIEFKEAQNLIVDLLGVDRVRAAVEMTQARSPKVSLSYQRDLYEDCCEKQH